MPLDQPLELFAGERIVEECVLSFHSGKATLRCSLRERWADCLIAFLRCGNAQTFRLKRIVGVSKRELTTLENAVKVKLGVDGLASFTGQLKEQATTEVAMQESSEEEQEFRFEAPAKGLLAVLVYQMQRVYYLTYEDNRWGRRNHGFQLTVTEWLRRFFDDSKRHEVDEQCSGGIEGRGSEAGPDVPTGRLRIDFAGFTMSIDCVRTDRGLEVPSLDAFVAPRDLGKILSVPGSFERSIVPDHLLFLANEIGATLRGQFRAPVGAEIMGLPVEAAESIQIRKALAQE